MFKSGVVEINFAHDLKSSESFRNEEILRYVKVYLSIIDIASECVSLVSEKLFVILHIGSPVTVSCFNQNEHHSFLYF